MYSFFKFCSLEPTCQRPNKPLRRFSQNKDCCTKRICQPWCCVSQRYFHSSQSHWRNWSACSVKRRRPWSSRNNSSSSMGRKTSSVIIPNPRGISDVVIYKHILILKVFLFERKTNMYLLHGKVAMHWFNIYICVMERWVFYYDVMVLCWGWWYVKWS